MQETKPFTGRPADSNTLEEEMHFSPAVAALAQEFIGGEEGRFTERQYQEVWTLVLGSMQCYEGTCHDRHAMI
jgi:hypothetical protein